MFIISSTISSRRIHELNNVCVFVVGAANYDPHPAVANFLQKREIRYRELDIAENKGRDFVKKIRDWCIIKCLNAIRLFTLCTKNMLPGNIFRGTTAL
jgi:hypothetical protein